MNGISFKHYLIILVEVIILILLIVLSYDKFVDQKLKESNYSFQGDNFVHRNLDNPKHDRYLIHNRTINNNEFYIDAPLLKQFPELPTGCEATAATMLINFYGNKATKLEVDESIPKAPMAYLKNGAFYGADLNEFFVGNSRSYEGFGTYHKTIAKAVNKFTDNNALDITGYDFDQLLLRLRKGTPIVVWTTIDVKDPSKTYDYYAGDEKYQWHVGEHAVLLVGYDNENVIVNDPTYGEVKKYPREQFQKIYNIMGRQAVTLK